MYGKIISYTCAVFQLVYQKARSYHTSYNFAFITFNI